MAWQVQGQLFVRKLNNPKLLDLSLKYIKESAMGLDDLRFASLHIVAQFCLTAEGESF